MFKVRSINKALVLTIAALGITGSAHAQPEKDWYRVEVIVFRNWSGADTERFRIEPPAPGFQTLTVLHGAGSRAFRRLRGGELSLQGAVDRLASSPDYEVLEHFGWQQPALVEEKAISVALPLGWQPSALTFDARQHPLGIPVIRASADTANGSSNTGAAGGESAQGNADNGQAAAPPEPGLFDSLPTRTQLYGTLTLFRGRYLHMDADLGYRLRYYQPSRTDRRTAAPETPVYVLKQRRRMRSDELHYLDHPAIGLLIKVTPLEMTSPEEAASTEPRQTNLTTGE